LLTQEAAFRENSFFCQLHQTMTGFASTVSLLLELDVNIKTIKSQNSFKHLNIYYTNRTQSAKRKYNDYPIKTQNY